MSPLFLQPVCQKKVSDIDSAEQDYQASKPASPVSIMPDPKVSTAGIDKLLNNLHTDKIAGPGYSVKTPHLVAFYNTLGIRRTHSRLTSPPPGPHGGRDRDSANRVVHSQCKSSIQKGG